MRLSCQHPTAWFVAALLAAGAAGAAAGCDEFKSSPVEVNGAAAASFTVAPGREIDFLMQTIGPGSYAVPPVLDGSAIAFLEVTPGEADPGGVTQVFHFRAGDRGTTVITFQRIVEREPGFAQAPYTVTDTVVVR